MQSSDAVSFLSRLRRGLSGCNHRPVPDPLFGAVMHAISLVPVDFGGGCPPKKAFALAWLIRAARLSSALDIGVYRGRCLVPQAIAHRDYTGGIAYGVDPFSNSEAMQHDNAALQDRLRDFAATTDFESIYTDVLRLRDRLGLAAHCRVVRKTSQEAAKDFAAEGRRFGLIHIDGNHDKAKVLADVEAYLPLLTPGGFVVLDDVSGASVKPGVDAVASRATLVFYESRPTITELDYAVFWTGRSLRKARIPSCESSPATWVSRASIRSQKHSLIWERLHTTARH